MLDDKDYEEPSLLRTASADEDNEELAPSGGGTSYVAIAFGLAGIVFGALALFKSFTSPGAADVSQTETAVIEAKNDIDKLAGTVGSLEERLGKIELTVDRLESFASQGNDNLVRQVRSQLGEFAKKLNDDSRDISRLYDELDKLARTINARTTIPSPPEPAGVSLFSNTDTETTETAEAETESDGEGAVRLHTVEPGDNYYKIAPKYGVTVSAIIQANPDVEPSKLQVGQKIRIPNAE